MHILGTPLARIDWKFLERLATDHTPESITHDYKARFPEPRDTEAKTRFLKSASAFANTVGGVFVFGMDESGESWLTGLPKLDKDRDVLSLHNLMRSGIEPALHHAQPVTVSGPAGEKVLLFAIPRSLAAPHEVNQNYGGGYWRRNSRSNYPMAVTELRRAFEESDSWRRDAQRFRDDRISFVTNGSLQGGLTGSYTGEAPALFFHVLPLGRLGELIDTNTLLAFGDKEANEPSKVEDVAIVRPNVDGWIRYLSSNGERRHIQLFRNGAFEYYADLAVFKARPDLKYLEGNWFDSGVVRIAAKAFDWSSAVGLTGPFIVSLSLRQVNGISFRYGSRGFLGGGGFDRDVIDPPPLVIDEPPQNVSLALWPLLDSVWLAAGASHDPHFDAKGNWSLSADTFRFDPM